MSGLNSADLRPVAVTESPPSPPPPPPLLLLLGVGRDGVSSFTDLPLLWNDSVLTKSLKSLPV